MKHGIRVLVAMSVVLGLVATGVAWAHPGRTNSAGCHNNRRTGGYHCHGGGGYSGGWDAPVETPTRLRVVAIPRARVWINDQYAGVSPTRAVQVGRGQVKVRLEHVALGVHEVTANVTSGETTELTVRW